jgi:hypothetical protein
MMKMVTAQAAAQSSGAAAVAAKEAAVNAAGLDQDFYNYLLIICGALVVALVIWRVWSESVKHVRMLTCLNNETQRYFTLPSQSYASFKKHFLYAPIFSKRHNREFQLSAAINVGTLPTRFQLLFLMSYFGTNIAFCVVSIDWHEDFVTVAMQVRNRTGILAVLNMVRSSFHFVVNPTGLDLNDHVKHRY